MLSAAKLLLPALFPSWRFFRTVQPSPRIEWRCVGGGWSEVCPRPPNLSVWRAAFSLFWNAHWNEGLYLVSLAERISETRTPHAEAEIFRIITTRHPNEAGRRVQFRIIFVTRVNTEITYQSGFRQLDEF